MTTTSPRLSAPTGRERADRCPGVVHPWTAEDGALARVRLVGGRITARQLTALSSIAATWGDGDLHLTSRANLQLRGLPASDGALREDVVAAIEDAGLLPSRAHDRARNVMVSPLTGRRGGRADVWPVAVALDERLCADPVLAALPGRFLIVLDDGRGDLADAPVDLGLVALDDAHAQLRLGSSAWGDVVPLARAADVMLDLARRFLDLRGDDDSAAWHVDELGTPLAEQRERDGRTSVTSPPLSFDEQHVAAPGGVLEPDLVARLAARGNDLTVTPWRGVLVTEEIR